MGTYFNFEVPGSVSDIMVKPIISVLGTDSQKKYWLNLLNKNLVYGCYAQTELGHGSDVQSLETQAIYNSQTNTFILHSPTTSSYKWWPGEMGVFSSIAIVYAAVIIKGKKVAVLPFVC